METKEPIVTRRIAIYREEQSLTIAPRQREADVGDQIVFRNTTGKPMTLLIPDEELFGTTGAFTIDPRGGARQFTVQEGASGGYPYAVYSLETREFAHASVPIIIIFPRT